MFIICVCCDTSKHNTKQTPFDSPFDFVSTLLEWIDSKVKATVLMFKKLDFGFWAKGFTRHFGQKMAFPKKKMKTSQTFHISSLMYLQSFWPRNMHLKMTCSMGAYCKLYKGNRYILCVNSATRPKINRERNKRL